MPRRLARILLVGADSSIVAVVRRLVDDEKGCALQLVGAPDGALDQITLEDASLVIAYLAQARNVTRLPEFVEFVNRVAHGAAALPVVVLAETVDVDMKLRFVEAGAIDVLARPLNLSRLGFLIDLLTVRSRYAPRAAVAGTAGSRSEFLWHAQIMRQLGESVQRVAPLDTTLLLTGETGTGKSHLARLIHELSPRRDGPLVTVQCGALPTTLIESELFGHVRGAFTGADRDQLGKFAQARGGTLFLDEVDSLPLEAQTKLLRAFEERMFEPIGAACSQTLDARLLIAANRSLEEEVAAGRFRGDLYYRLNVVTLHLPPLRQRPEDILPLAGRFLADYSARMGRPAACLTDEARSLLESYSWPGNIRELRNAIECCVALSSTDVLGVEDITPALRGRPASLPWQSASPIAAPLAAPENQLARARHEAELARLQGTLARHSNNRTRAAMDLGISRVTLYKKLQQYGLA